MPEDISAQILTQATENIQKLFDLGTRLDERVKSISNKQEELEKKINETNQKNIDLNQKIAVIETLIISAKEIFIEVKSLNDSFSTLEKRISEVENKQGAHDERWKGVANFLLQLSWVILAAYLLTKLNLQSPAVP